MPIEIGIFAAFLDSVLQKLACVELYDDYCDKRYAHERCLTLRSFPGVSRFPRLYGNDGNLEARVYTVYSDREGSYKRVITHAPLYKQTYYTIELVSLHRR